MRYRKLGRTGLTVSNLCFGTGGLTNGSDADTPAGIRIAQDTVRAIFDGPAHFIDTSRIYGRGRSEQRIGEVIRERGGLPPGFLLATKLDLDFNTRRFDGAAARRSLEASIKALGLDHFHVLHLHDPEFISDPNDISGPNGSMIELMKMVGATSGVIRRPFVIEGILKGVLASLLAGTLLTILTWALSHRIPEVQPLSIPLFFAFIMFGAILGGFGSIASLQGYLQRWSRE